MSKAYMQICLSCEIADKTVPRPIRALMSCCGPVAHAATCR